MSSERNIGLYYENNTEKGNGSKKPLYAAVVTTTDSEDVIISDSPTKLGNLLGNFTRGSLVTFDIDSKSLCIKNDDREVELSCIWGEGGCIESELEFWRAFLNTGVVMPASLTPMHKLLHY